MKKQIINLFRHQRHDFVNNLMIIDGFLQIENSDKARQYIQSVCGQFKVEGDIIKIRYEEFVLALLLAKDQYYNKGITLTIEATTDFRASALDEQVLLDILDKLSSLIPSIQGYSNYWDFKLNSENNQYCWSMSLNGLSSQAFNQLLDFLAQEDYKEKICFMVKDEAVVDILW